MSLCEPAGSPPKSNVRLPAIPEAWECSQKRYYRVARGMLPVCHNKRDSLVSVDWLEAHFSKGSLR
jgi:hypothetical protein